MSAGSLHPRLLATGGLIAIAAAIGIGRFIYTPILPAMADGLHLTKGEAGLMRRFMNQRQRSGDITALEQART